MPNDAALDFDMFPLGADDTPYRQIDGDFVGTTTFQGESILTVDTAALTTLTREAFHDIAHFLRPGHLQQLANILEDPEASDNDRYVALDLLKNANISAGGVLPMCQDTAPPSSWARRGTGSGPAAVTRRP